MCAASSTSAEIFGCVSSSRICVRVRIGPTRECMSPTILFTDSVVFFSCRNSTIRMVVCTSSAIAAARIKTCIVICIHTRSFPQPQRRNPSRLNKPSRLRFAKKRLASRIHCRGQRFPLARSHVLAALNQFVGAFPQLLCPLLGKFPPVIRALRQVLARVFPGLRRKQDAHQSAYSKSHQKVTHLASNVVSHNRLHAMNVAYACERRNTA